MSIPWNPAPYQLEFTRFILENANCGLFADPGCRKTSCVLAAMRVLKEQGMLGRALVVAPPRVATNVWPDEVYKWADFATALSPVVMHGPHKEKLFRLVADGALKPDLITVSHDGLLWLLEGDGERLDALNVTMLVVDESSYFRHSNTQRFKALRKILHRFKRRVILTGTPIPNGYEGLWSQVYILDRGGALEPYISHYRLKYFMDLGRDYSDWQVRPECVPLIDAAVRPFVLRGDAQELVGMPDLIYNPVLVDLPPAARAVYDEMETKFQATLSNGETVFSPTTATMGQKLRQIANGFVYNADGLSLRTTRLHDEKVKALANLLGELQGQRALILYEFVADKEAILDALDGARCPVRCLADATTPTAVTETLAGFNSGQFHLLAHRASVGHGLNIQQHSQHIIEFGLTWDLELHIQSIARIWRSGNPHEQVFVHTIAVANSTEDRVAKVLAGKNRTQRALLAAMRRPQAVGVPA